MRDTTTYEYADNGIRVSAQQVIEYSDGNGGWQMPHLQIETTYLNDPTNPTGYSQVLLEGRTDELTGQKTQVAYVIGHDLIAQSTATWNEGTQSFDAPTVITFLYDGHGTTRAWTDPSFVGQAPACRNCLDRLDRFTVYEYDNLHRQIAEEWWEDDAFPAVGVSTSTEGGGGNDEVQVVTLSDTTGGTFRLGFGGNWSAALAWNASTAAVDAALEALSGANTISVSGSTGGPWTITFTGDYANQDIAPLFSRANDLTNPDLQRTISYSFNDDGDLEQVSDPDAMYDYDYDEMGRVTNFIQNIAGLNPEIKFENAYNAASRRTQLQAHFDSTKDFKNTYGYDNMQRLSVLVQQTASGGNVVAPKRIEFNYNEINQYTAINRYASTNQSEFVAASYYTYDDMNRLTKLVHSESTSAPTSGWGIDPLAGYEYVYDAASRILSIDSLLDGLSNYAHDDTNQLIDADHATMTDEAYEYDTNGNRIMSGYDVDPNNQLYSDGTYNYTYDDEGNRLTRTKISNGYVTRYEWDFRNRLVKVTEEDNASGVLQFTENFYDAYNQWIRRSFDADGPSGTAAVDTFFIYESGQIVLQFDGNDDSDLSHRYLWGEQVDQLFADETVTSLGSAGTVIWPLGNQVGTLNDLVTYNSGTDDATVPNHREYDSYGNLTDETNAAIDLLFGFTGRAYDETTGSQHNTHRVYDALTGRWLSEDPIGFAGLDDNVGRYVGNAPLIWTDPSGLVLVGAYWINYVIGGGINRGADGVDWVLGANGWISQPIRQGTGFSTSMTIAGDPTAQAYFAYQEARRHMRNGTTAPAAMAIGVARQTPIARSVLAGEELFQQQSSQADNINQELTLLDNAGRILTIGGDVAAIVPIARALRQPCPPPPPVPELPVLQPAPAVPLEPPLVMPPMNGTITPPAVPAHFGTGWIRWPPSGPFLPTANNLPPMGFPNARPAPPPFGWTRPPRWLPPDEPWWPSGPRPFPRDFPPHLN